MAFILTKTSLSEATAMHCEFYCTVTSKLLYTERCVCVCYPACGIQWDSQNHCVAPERLSTRRFFWSTLLRMTHKFCETDIVFCAN